MGKLDGKVALVTGSGRGIGRAVAQKLAGDGALVVVNDLDADPVRDTVHAINSAGGQATGCPGDVTAPQFPDRFVATAVEAFGGIDIIVNNAGYTWDAVIQKMTDEQWDTIHDVHVKAPFRILRAAQPVISAAVKRQRSEGTGVTCRKVVNVSSVAGTGGSAGQANYSAAKAGILGLTRSLAKEWGRYNVTVNSVVFGLIRTRLTEPAPSGEVKIEVAERTITIGVDRDLMTSAEGAIPLGRAGQADEAAGAVYLLCIPESDYVTGQTLTCAGGLNW